MRLLSLMLARRGCATAAARVLQGDLRNLSPKVKAFIEENAKICQPASIHICDGSAAENSRLTAALVQAGVVKPLPALKNCYLARTDPADVARVESKTVISTERKEDTIPTPKEGVTGELGIWMAPDVLDKECKERFPGCMKGRTMYVIPFSMGPVGSPLSKIGVQLTDSAYVVASMRIMTRVGGSVLSTLGSGDFIKCLHSVGQPLPMANAPVNNWPCNPVQTLVSHIPAAYEIRSFGSGYGGNSLLGKKCFALRIGSTLARSEGWLAEHMLILGITNPQGKKRYIAAAFPSACGKTNLAMMSPSLPGYKVECVGDDIAWMRFDEAGKLHAINPEAGFFGVAPGTSMATNPSAMLTIKENTLFTNVAETADGNVWWEGHDDAPSPGMIDWHGNPWTPDSGTLAAHPNSRFCAPASQCPVIDSAWEDSKGVPIDAIIFGGRRPAGVPLVYEAFNWRHGVFVGAAMRSEVTAAAQDVKGKVIRHDPFAMKPFFGYNFGKYLQHWLDMEQPGRDVPSIYHVNWFRKSQKGGFLWPGFGENSRVIDWICRRLDGEDSGVNSPIGILPKKGAISTEGLAEMPEMGELFKLPVEFWKNEVEAIQKYFDEQLPHDLPPAIGQELAELRKRVSNM